MIDDLAELGLLTFHDALRHAGASRDEMAVHIPGEMVEAKPTDLVELVSALLTRSTLVLTSPELALLEALATADYAGEVVVFVPPTLPSHRVVSLKRNIPAGLDVTFCPAGVQPPHLTPFGSSFLSVGIDAGGGTTLLQAWAASVTAFWRGQVWFGARCLLLPYPVLARSRPPGWAAVTTSTAFTTVLGETSRPLSEEAR